MVSPKYSTHVLNSLTKSSTETPHEMSFYLDYNCPFSAKLFGKFRESVIPEIQKKHPGKFEFVFMNVIQPWHPNSIYMHEFSLSIAKLIREKGGNGELFWSVSDSLFKNIKKFYDSANSDKSRNAIYEDLYEVVSNEVEIPFTKDEVLSNLVIKQASNEDDYSNSGNALGVDVKYFTRYHRTVGVHITPTVFVDGIVSPSIESSSEPSKLVEVLESYL